ncbi:MAG: hypothetical protein ACLGH3_00105 [Actinomycetota bacterium]
MSEHDRENQPPEELPADASADGGETPSLEPPEPTSAPAAPLPAETETVVYEASGSKAGKVIVAALLILALGTVGTIVFLNNSGATDPAAARVPRTTDLFVQVTLEPSIEQQRAVRDFADRLPGGREMAEDLVDNALRQMFEGAPGGLTYQEVEPWLGAQIAVAVQDLNDAENTAVVLLQSDDDQAAEESLKKLPDSETATEVSKGWAYIAANQGAIGRLQQDASNDPLIRDRAFQQQRGKVGGDGIVLVRLDPRSLTEQRSFGLDLGTLGTNDPGVLGIRMADEGIVLTGVGTAALRGTSGIPALMDAAPGSTLGAISFFDLAEVIRQVAPAFEQEAGTEPDALLQQFGLSLEDDFLSWLGGETAIIVGDPQIGEFAAIIDATDPDAMTATLKKLRSLAAIAGAASEDLSLKGPDDDMVLTIEGNRVRIKTDGSRLIVSPSPGYVDEILDPASTLAAGPMYKRLLPGGTEVAAQGFVNFDAIRNLIPDEAAPFFAVFDGFAMRSRYESGDQIFTMTLAYAE